jgi:2'-5' RNA ligase
VVWIKDEAAHVTVRFIGAVDDGRVPAIEAALHEPIEIGPFDLEWSIVGTFPSAGAPRVVWLGATNDLEPIRQLATLVNARLDALVGAGESRPLTPHLTLARIKEPGRGVAWAQALAGVKTTPTLSRIDHVTLYESHTGPKGSTYTVRMRTPLGSR